jgi:hypothetical protein
MMPSTARYQLSTDASYINFAASRTAMNSSRNARIDAQQFRCAV